MPLTFFEEFGRRVARRRHILRLKQHEVAAAIGTQRSHVSALEHGRQVMMRLDQLMALAQKLRTSSDYLLQLVDVDPGEVPPLPCPAEGASQARLPLCQLPTLYMRGQTTMSIAESEAHPSPHQLVAAYPCMQLHHWFAMAQAPVSRMRAYLESCEGPTPIAEEMRQVYLDVLRDCEELLQVPLAPALRKQLARETAQLDADVHAQRTRKVGVRRRKARVAAAD